MRLLAGQAPGMLRVLVLVLSAQTTGMRVQMRHGTDAQRQTWQNQPVRPGRLTAGWRGRGGAITAPHSNHVMPAPTRE